jgi:hypothetical protein
MGAWAVFLYSQPTQAGLVKVDIHFAYFDLVSFSNDNLSFALKKVNHADCKHPHFRFHTQRSGQPT